MIGTSDLRPTLLTPASCSLAEIGWDDVAGSRGIRTPAVRLGMVEAGIFLDPDPRSKDLEEEPSRVESESEPDITRDSELDITVDCGELTGG